MLSPGHHLVLPWRGICTLPCTGSCVFLFLLIFFSPGAAWPFAGLSDYRFLFDTCPGAEWNIMCRGCCEYDLIRCKCPAQGTLVGYAVPCCRNALNECDPCIFHPGCSIFENCKRCNNGTWVAKDDFFVKGKYCTACRPGWSGGNCMKCGGVIRKPQGHVLLEGYPTNARCEWTLQVGRESTVELRFRMLSLEFDHSCRYDYVEVRDGDSLNSPVIGRYCGNERPTPIQSSGNYLHILFVSDGYKNFDGFFATFQESSACSSSPCLHDGTCILDSTQGYRCACLAGYTGPRCENMVLCRRPLSPVNGAMQNLCLHFGGRVTFRCDQGFTLQGARTATCLLDGTWSARPPSCVPKEREETCPVPLKPANGDYFLVYGPEDVLIAVQYLCYRPYVLKGTSQRACLSNNTWSGIMPKCVIVEDVGTEEKKDKDNDTVKTPTNATKDTEETVISKNTTFEKPEKREEGDKDMGKKTETEPERISCPSPPKLFNGYQQLVLGLGKVPDMMEYFCNNSYALSGSSLRICQVDGTWSGKQPVCVRACREPKVSELVRQKVLPPDVPYRKTPVHKLYSSSIPVTPTKTAPVLPELSPGFHHVYTHIEYECVSPFYHHSGSSRRTCLKTGKWSGRHVSCSPVCGKLPAINPQKVAETRWPWQAAIYRRSLKDPGPEIDKEESLSLSFGMGLIKEEVEAARWQLVCSGALVNHRTVVVAAHCVSELGKAVPFKPIELKVVLGKHYRSDVREIRSLQHLRVSTVLVHPNYDPLVLDSDLAVLKLLDKARIGERVLPICLPEMPSGEAPGVHAYVTGWSLEAGTSEETARAGMVELGDTVQCERQYARHGVAVSVTEGMLCGRPHHRIPSDICPADTGGIVVFPSPTGTDSESHDPGHHVWTLLGLVSFGYDQRSCSPELYTIYTRVSSFKEWIEKNMK